jgi:hypothetical protein
MSLVSLGELHAKKIQKMKSICTNWINQYENNVNNGDRQYQYGGSQSVYIT